jgi:hypothetical protein
LDETLLDPHQVLHYSSKKLYRKFLGLGALCLGLGVLLAWLDPSSFNLYDRVMLVLCFVLGGGLTAYGLFRQFVHGKPLVTLSPEGIRMRIQGVKTYLIPWHEVRGVETTDIHTRFRGRPVLFLGVTVVLVTRAFYDHVIHVDSWILRGPGWDAAYIPKGDMVQVALHHEALPATAEELRTAVATRWKAFRDGTRMSHIPRVPLRHGI